MRATKMSAFGAGVGLLAAGAMALTIFAGVPSPALAEPQEGSAEADKARIEAQRAESLARQKAELAELERSHRFAVQEKVQQAEALAAALAERIATSAAQDRSRIAIRGPRGIVRGFGFGGSSAERVLSHAEELGLTDGQRDQIRAAQKQHRRDGIEREAAIDLARLDLDELMEADTADMDLGAVEAKLLEISRLEVQDQVADLRLRQSVRAALTPEQRDQLEELGNVFVIGDNEFGWHDGGLMLRRPGREMLFELREGMPRWRDRIEGEWRDGHWFFRHDEDDEDDEEGEEGEGVEIRTFGRSASSRGETVIL